MDTTTSAAPTFDAAFTAFLAAAQGIVDHYMSTNFPMLPRKVLSTMPGRRYVKIVITYAGESSGRSVYCFVDRSNGDILKAETWKAPAKGPRGNIYTTTDFTKSVDWHGALYAR